MSKLLRKKNVEEIADLEVKKGGVLEEKMGLDLKDVEIVKTEEKTMEADRRVDHPTSNHKVVVRLDQEETVGNSHLLIFNTKIGLIFAI